MWVRRETPLDCNGVEFGQAVPDECGVCDGDGSSCAPVIASCAQASASGVYNVGGELVACDAERDGGGWTLVASFVNTDGHVSWSGSSQGYEAWRDGSTFGRASSYTAADYKSPSFSLLAANDLMVTDAFGFVSFSDAMAGATMAQLMSTVAECQTAPQVPPGDARVHASSVSLTAASSLFGLSL